MESYGITIKDGVLTFSQSYSPTYWNEALTQEYKDVVTSVVIKKATDQRLTENMLAGMTSIETATIEGAVYTISNGFFSGCTALNEVRFLGAALDQLGESVFENTKLSSENKGINCYRKDKNRNYHRRE